MVACLAPLWLHSGQDPALPPGLASRHVPCLYTAPPFGILYTNTLFIFLMELSILHNYFLEFISPPHHLPQHPLSCQSPAFKGQGWCFLLQVTDCSVRDSSTVPGTSKCLKVFVEWLNKSQLLYETAWLSISINFYQRTQKSSSQLFMEDLEPHCKQEPWRLHWPPRTLSHRCVEIRAHHISGHVCV